MSLIIFHGTVSCNWRLSHLIMSTGDIVGSRKKLKIVPSGAYVENAPYGLFLECVSFWYDCFMFIFSCIHVVLTCKEVKIMQKVPLEH